MNTLSFKGLNRCAFAVCGVLLLSAPVLMICHLYWLAYLLPAAGGTAFLLLFLAYERTATAGNLISWMICQNEMVQNQWAFVYHFTFLPVAVCLPFLLPAASAVPLIFYKKICNKSVVERLRYV